MISWWDNTYGINFPNLEISLKQVPRGITIGSFNIAFYGVIIACGYMADYHPMVLPETYRMIDHYWGFTGQKIFVPYVYVPAAIRYRDWQETTSDFTMVWRQEKACL